MKLNPKKQGGVPTKGKLVKLLEKQIGPEEHREIDTLSKYDGNPRKHPKKQICKLAASINEFGFTVPGCCRSNGNSSPLRAIRPIVT